MLIHIHNLTISKQKWLPIIPEGVYVTNIAYTFSIAGEKNAYLRIDHQHPSRKKKTRKAQIYAYIKLESLINSLSVINKLFI